MNTKEAVESRLLELCKQRRISVNALAIISGVSPSTVYSVLLNERKNPGIVTIKKLCDGLEMTLGEFFSTEVFDTLEQEIR